MRGGRTRAGRGAPSPQFKAFVSEIVALARSVAPEVANILDPEREIPAKPWSGERERGLKLCASMLKYARLELADDAEAGRLDAAIETLKMLLEREASAESDVEP